MVRILCVEDETGLREDLVELLEDEGYEVAAVANGAEALDLLATFRPDLVISDCLMPVMTGAEMLQAIRNSYPDFAATPTIFLSAHAQKAHIEEGLEVGAAAYLAKPVDYEKLLTTIAEVVGMDRGSRTNCGKDD